jgi:acetyl-CoA acetyltransferase
MDAVTMAAAGDPRSRRRSVIAGGSESMSRAPFVMAKATSAFDRNAEMYDTTIGWRFVNPKMKGAYGDDTMPSTAENVARMAGQPRGPGRLRRPQPGQGGRGAGEWPLRRRDRRRSRSRSARAIRSSSTATSIRADQRRALAKAEADRPADGTVTAGNASGVNDGAAAMIVAARKRPRRNGLTPRARIVGGGVPASSPRIMGIGPRPLAEAAAAPRASPSPTWT